MKKLTVVAITNVVIILIVAGLFYSTGKIWSLFLLIGLMSVTDDDNEGHLY